MQPVDLDVILGQRADDPEPERVTVFTLTEQTSDGPVVVEHKVEARPRAGLMLRLLDLARRGRGDNYIRTMLLTAMLSPTSYGALVRVGDEVGDQAIEDVYRVCLGIANGTVDPTKASRPAGSPTTSGTSEHSKTSSPTSESTSGSTTPATSPGTSSDGTPTEQSATPEPSQQQPAERSPLPVVPIL